MKRHALITMALALLFASSPGQPAYADSPPGGSPAGNREGTFSVSPIVGGVSFGGAQHLETAPVFGLRAGYNFTNNLEAEALFDYAKTRSTLADVHTDFLRYGADLLWNFRPDEKFVPNLAAGYTGMQLKSDTKGAFDLGGGFKYFVTEDMAWRGDVRGIFFDNKLDQYAIEYTTGVYIPFGAAPAVAKLPAPPPPPEPVARPLPAAPPTLNLALPPAPAPVPIPAPEVELAANPVTIKKGERSVLTWKSKRADSCDMRPDVGQVAPNGSTIVTPDADTIYSLTCKGKGGSAAANAAIVVAQPTKAEKRFCNQPAVLMINFDTDKWNIKPQYHAELKTVGDFLTQFPEAYGEISGHTDSTASDDYNQRLSERRAQSVRDYIVKNFKIDPKRLTSKGYGEKRPVATNKTAVGRAKNRRIEANLVCEKRGGIVEQAPQPGPSSLATVPQPATASATPKEGAPGKKPLALVPAKENVSQQGDVPAARRQGEQETRFFPQAGEPDASASGSTLLPAAQRKGEQEPGYPPGAEAAQLREGALPPPLAAAQRKTDPAPFYPERSAEGAGLPGRAPAPLPSARVTQEAGLLPGGGPAATEVEAARRPPQLPLAKRTEQAALPTSQSPATSAPAAPPATAAAPAPLAPAAVPDVDPVASALRKQEPQAPAPDEEPFVLKGTDPADPARGKLSLTGVTIDKNGLSLFTNGKVNDFRMITMVEPYSLVIDLYGAVSGMGAAKAAVAKFDLTYVRFREFPEYLQITLDAGREEIIPYRSYKTPTGLRIDIKPRSSHHIGP